MSNGTGAAAAAAVVPAAAAAAAAASAAFHEAASLAAVSLRCAIAAKSKSTGAGAGLESGNARRDTAPMMALVCAVAPGISAMPSPSPSPISPPNKACQILIAVSKAVIQFNTLNLPDIARCVKGRR